MRQYFLRRLLLLPITLLGITFIAFLITRFVPGGPLEQAVAEKQAFAGRGTGRGMENNSVLSPEEELQLKRFYGLDQPFLPAYVAWLGIWPRPINSQVVLVPFGEKSVETQLVYEVSNTGDAPLVLRIPATISLNVDGSPSITLDPAKASQAVAVFAKEHNVEANSLEPRVQAGWTARLLKTDNPVTATTASNQPVKVDIFQLKIDGLLQGNLGRSYLRNQPVLDIIVEKLPVSAWFGLWTLVLTYGICIPLGIVKALRHRTAIDNTTSLLLFIGYALPGYILAVILQYAFAFHLKWLPHSGFVSEGFSQLGFWQKTGDLLWHTFLPLVCLTFGTFALMTMLMKNTLMDNLALDYVRTAVAKGVSFRSAVINHAFRNSLVPIATSFGNSVGLLLTGSFLIEKIFDIDGVGLLSYSSLVERDYPVFLGLLTCSAFLLLLGNIISDVCVAWVDPRIRFDK
ncbi:MAG: ABC transporter permease subunit [Puniceicoccales bacterium]|jgi:microcin C transport system permease protein|nr:ABC transporter permease subunit [Puniceicoccales bacterium]